MESEKKNLTFTAKILNARVTENENKVVCGV